MSVTVTGVVYSPAEWKAKEEAERSGAEPPAGKATAGAFANVTEPPSAAALKEPFYEGDQWYVFAEVLNPKTNAVEGMVEALAVESLSEAGIWRIVLTSAAPLKKLRPTSITVQKVGEF